ncbi:5-amino-6-(5-phospho-D-ribitylamino)uracil phosphatase YigB [Photobacterium leiognathi]|uniref:5-amino-6-(5-phospho-D-ribitylamino)uracil phosphatase YigB n=1 Tax=Photobacterium leiognathi TaxID=553611 RepID=UPI0027396FB9|nr:5-amino-6-(5-phospho-D-ribitylamino)uracil phosphatase YigB [Photobacterium leiognathi]
MRFYSQLMPVRALTFDLDDTLYDNRPVISRVEQAVILWLSKTLPSHLTLDVNSWLRLQQQLAVIDPMLKHNSREWRRKTLKTGFMQLGFRLKDAETLAQQGLDVAIEMRNRIDIPDETHRVLKTLSAHFPLIALTNGDVDVDKIGLAQYFVEVYQAGRDGLSKPEPDLFNLAVQKLQLPAENILHVGDHLTTDVHGAKLCGLQTCWFNDQNKKISHDLKAITLPDVEITLLSQLLEIDGIKNLAPNSISKCDTL